VALAVVPRYWPLSLAAAVANQLMLAAIGMWPSSCLLGPNLVRLPTDSPQGVALTFDDGPDPEVTPAVLDLLELHGAVATFFCIGERAVRHPEILQEILRRGHRVENHTFFHSPFFAFSSPRGLDRELNRAQEALAKLTAREPSYFRAPAGIRSPLLEPALARRGLHLAAWTHRGFDTAERNPHRVVQRLLRHLSAGDILLLHDGNSARTRDGRPVVLEALPRILEALGEKGLKTLPLPEVRTSREPKPPPQRHH